MARPHHSARTKARKRALDILFEAELRGRDRLQTLAEHTANAEPPVRDFTAELVSGVNEHLASIDHRIESSLDGSWTIERMPAVDRNLARIAIFEIDHTDISPEAAISEAVQLSGELSTDESPGFLNGMLAVALATSNQRK